MLLEQLATHWNLVRIKLKLTFFFILKLFRINLLAFDNERGSLFGHAAEVEVSLRTSLSPCATKGLDV